MARILDALDHPERHLPPVIHVAGTNGKGSTIAFMRAILEAAGQARACLYVAEPGSPQRTIPHRAQRWRQAGRRCRARRRARRMRGQKRRRSDHGVRDRDGRGVSIVLAQSGRRVAAGSRARRPARRHQRDRSPAGKHYHPAVARPPRISRRHARKDRRRKGRHYQARCAGDYRRPAARGARRDRTPGGAAQGAGAYCRRTLDRDRRTRPARLSGRRRASRFAARQSFMAAINSRMPAPRSRRCASAG